MTTFDISGAGAATDDTLRDRLAEALGWSNENGPPSESAMVGFVRYLKDHHDGHPKPACSDWPDYETVYRWMYAAVIELAKIELAIANSEAEPGEWPCGQEWDGLSGSSKGAFLQRAREKLGINHDEFLKPVRAAAIEVSDLFGD